MQSYTPEIKAQVIAEWTAGASADQLAARYKMPRTTIQTWTKKRRRAQLVLKKNPLDDYDFDTAAVGLIDGSVRAFQAILSAAEDPQWIKGHNPSEAAILAGVIADKLYRLLAAIERQPTLAAGANEGAPLPG